MKLGKKKKAGGEQRILDLWHHEEEKPKSKSWFFLWSVWLLLLTGACFASWILCFYVVAHPENPRCYQLLKKLKRLDPPKRFAETKVPPGEFFSVAKLLDRYGKLGPVELERANSEMLRAYLMNFNETKEPPVYVTGKYDVVDTYVLGPGDLFPSGAAVVAQSLDSPQVLLELVFTATTDTATVIKTALPPGSNIHLRRSVDLLALLHAARLDDGRMQFTAIPLPYGSWQVQPSQATFSLTPPEELESLPGKGFAIDVAAGLPLVRGERLKAGLNAYQEHRRKAFETAQSEEHPVSEPELVRYDRERDVTADAPAPKIIRETPAASRPPPEAAPAVPLPVRPPIVGPPDAANAPAVTPPAPPSSPAPAGALTPRVVSAPPPKNTVTVPRRVVSLQEACELAGTYQNSAPAILSGEFVVAEVKGRQVELHPPGTANGSSAPGAAPAPAPGGPLIVVTFPPGARLPVAGARLRRDAARGFLIKQVERRPDGQVTITATDNGL